MAIVLANGRDDVLRSFDTGSVSPATVIEFARTSNARALASDSDVRPRVQGVQGAIEELNSLVGLKRIKRIAEEIRALVEVQKLRREAQLLTEPQVLHMIFRGNPCCTWAKPVLQRCGSLRVACL